MIYGCYDRYAIIYNLLLIFPLMVKKINVVSVHQNEIASNQLDRDKDKEQDIRIDRFNYSDIQNNMHVE